MQKVQPREISEITILEILMYNKEEQPKSEKPKRPRRRSSEKEYPERIDASP